MLTLSAIRARVPFARHWAIAAILLIPTLSMAEERAPLVTYGPEAPSKEGDDDHVQLIVIKVPEAVKDKLYLRIFDADCGGLLDTIYDVPDTKTVLTLWSSRGSARGRERHTNPITWQTH